MMLVLETLARVMLLPEGVRWGTGAWGLEFVEVDEEALPRLVELACLEWVRSLCSPEPVIAASSGWRFGAPPGAADADVFGNMGSYRRPGGSCVVVVVALEARNGGDEGSQTVE